MPAAGDAAPLPGFPASDVACADAGPLGMTAEARCTGLATHRTGVILNYNTNVVHR